MIIAWDFDGVLNANHDGTGYVWEAEFQQVFGQPAADFGAFVFANTAPVVIAGEIDILDRLTEWVARTGIAFAPEEILTRWLAMDACPDAEMIALVDALQAAGTRQIIATNNEARRAAYIADAMGFGRRVERIFASGPMRVAKPDARYFAHITDELGVDPGEMLLVDDKPENIHAAIDAGWQGFHFSDRTRAELIGRLRP